MLHYSNKSGDAMPQMIASAHILTSMLLDSFSFIQPVFMVNVFYKLIIMKLSKPEELQDDFPLANGARFFNLALQLLALILLKNTVNLSTPVSILFSMCAGIANILVDHNALFNNNELKRQDKADEMEFKHFHNQFRTKW